MKYRLTLEVTAEVLASVYSDGGWSWEIYDAAGLAYSDGPHFDTREEAEADMKKWLQEHGAEEVTE